MMYRSRPRQKTRVAALRLSHETSAGTMTAKNGSTCQDDARTRPGTDPARRAAGDSACWHTYPLNLPPIAELGRIWAYPNLSPGNPIPDWYTVRFALYGDFSDPAEWPVLRGVSL
jgi:hypothetical protein